MSCETKKILFKEISKTKKYIVNWVKELATTHNIQGVVLGISGGKDSTVVAGLLVEALGADKVFGVMMPNGEQKDINDSIKVCQILKIDNDTINIQPILSTTINAIEKSLWYKPADSWESPEYCGRSKFGEEYFINDKVITNILPRIRMTILYGIAQSLGYFVAGTTNLSESFIGWGTKHGDMACDFNPIKHLTTDEVIAVGRELNIPEELLVKPPADGLTGKTDEENLGCTYAEINTYIKDGNDANIDTVIKNKIKKLNEVSSHKRCLPYTI